MTVGTSPIRWRPCWRVLPTRYIEELILRKVSSPKDFEIISQLDSMTNERLRQGRGEIDIVTPEDRVSGKGSQFIMAAFSYRNPEGTRFSDGTYGVYYAAHDLATAIAETKHHTERFMRRTNEGPMRLERRALRANLIGHLHDLRGLESKLPDVYSPTSYTASQRLAKELSKEHSFGIVYDSVRRDGGQCAAVFRPPVLSVCEPDVGLIFDWDGKNIAKTYQLTEVSGRKSKPK